ncbi:release factor glutamine methyltransferase [Verrucomicrobium sp. GAS474]|uniref:peptide chain release factor N(5)-glutamine methyltransferase n=1 Tax=Verrucomicrobium sp. GAS474 TaxID=1882831 RepID=UPI00087B543F|nr:peptide chain release factor N(5)-glutamine methyltransferase [Verrucomicrobium sp. GAS474]SDU19370.1 release factor glutamine methyltransferase [Verrucomicrobium sp. GAS474]
MTTLEFIDATTGYFAKNGVESPRLTAELMLAEVLKKKRLQLYMEFEKVVPEEALATLRPLARRRAQGEPLQYVQGFAEFAGARFAVTPDVLIPRPETEILLEAVTKALQADAESDAAAPLADIGTGSGILSVSLARRFPARPVHAVDISPAALAVARKNGEGLPNLAFHEGSLLAPLPSLPYRALVANLPYIPSAVIPTLTREVRQEPHLALDGGADGLDLVRALLAAVKERNAAPETRIAMVGLEICEGQAEETARLLGEAGYPGVEQIKDLRGVPRILIGK